MEQTGHPVLAALVPDSDGAQLVGYSPKAGDLAAPLAVRWASEAGFAPSAAVEAVLNGSDAFAEELFFEPLEVLGLPDLASTEA